MKWIDMWMSLTKGQRRATLTLLCIVVIVGVVQVVVSHNQRNSHDVTTHYTALESEITLFRQSLDTIPPSERQSGYRRRTDSEPDTTYKQPTKKSKSSKHNKSATSATPQVIEEMPRINDNNESQQRR